MKKGFNALERLRQEIMNVKVLTAHLEPGDLFKVGKLYTTRGGKIVLCTSTGAGATFAGVSLTGHEAIEYYTWWQKSQFSLFKGEVHLVQVEKEISVK